MIGIEMVRESMSDVEIAILRGFKCCYEKSTRTRVDLDLWNEL